MGGTGTGLDTSSVLTAISSGFTSSGTLTLTVLASVVPIALGVAGVIWAVRAGVRLYKGT